MSERNQRHLLVAVLGSTVVKLFTDQPNAPFSLFHLNVQSVRNKFDELGISLDSFTFSFDMLTETWYNQSDEVDQLEKYAVFNLSRSNKVGGGVCVCVKKCPGYTILSDFTVTTNDYEILTLQHAKFVFSVVHRPPSGNVATFLEFPENFLKFVGENKLCLYLGGDFNIDMLTSSKHQLDL
ncbi:uncharacterized protein LOC115318002, partial [Ixodes scapularis]|uniref:uncharacterized protein LOC115318002 n=1 Tax=Ixodes scapularis TaxID=6945 RepID=UPI001A9D3A7D